MCILCRSFMALKKLRLTSFPPPEAFAHSAVTWNCRNYHKWGSFSREREGAPHLPKQAVSQARRAVSSTMNLTRMSLLVEHPLPRGQRAVPRLDFSDRQRRAEGGTHCPRAHPGAMSSGERNCPISSEKSIDTPESKLCSVLGLFEHAVFILKRTQLTPSIHPGWKDYAFTTQGTEKARVSKSLFYASLILYPEDKYAV